MRIILSTISFMCMLGLQAQEYCPDPFGAFDDPRKYHVTIGGGITHLYGDIANPQTVGRAFFADFDYKVSKGFYAGLSTQLFGRLEALEGFDLRSVVNNYTSAGAKLTLHPFELFSDVRARRGSFADKLMNGFYLGVGAAVVFNNYDTVYRDPANPATFPESTDLNGDFISEQRRTSLILPSIHTGVVLPLGPVDHKRGPWSLVLNAQFNFATNDMLDGYRPHRENADGTFEPLNSANDMYNFYSAGLRYSF